MEADVSDAVHRYVETVGRSDDRARKPPAVEA
jgi:hypothetical protein